MFAAFVLEYKKSETNCFNVLIIFPKIIFRPSFMVYDICIKVKEIGDVYGNYYRTTKNSIYLKNTLLGRASSVLVSGFKIEKKYIISVTRMGGAPHFESFSSPQLKAVIELNIPAYTEKAQEILSQRALEEKRKSSSNTEREELSEMLLGESSPLSLNDKQSKNKKKKGEWNQFAANQKLYGIKPEFDLNDYSTEINRNASNYKELEERSSKIAKEIMSQATNDSHRLEERGLKRPTDVSEDRLYSAVNAEEKWAEEEPVAVASSNIPSSVSCEKASIIKELEEIGKLSKNYSETPDKDAWTEMAIALLSKKRALENKLQALNEEKKEPKDGSGSSDKSSNEKDEAVRKNKESSRRSNAPSDRQKNEDGQRIRGGKLNQRTSNRRQFDGSKHAESEAKPRKSVPEIEIASFKDVHECIEAMKNCFEARKNDQSASLPRLGGKYSGELYLSYTKAADNFEFSEERINDIIASVQKDLELFHKKHKLT